jgi:hypothetical protein
MFLVQILLPLYDSARKQFPQADFDLVASELTARFGGVTAYANAPAHGRWQDDEGRAELDDIIVLEVMTPNLEKGWWAEYRAVLEARFAQDELVVRALGIERL